LGRHLRLEAEADCLAGQDCELGEAGVVLEQRQQQIDAFRDLFDRELSI
jgi:hypothetical protein